MLTAPLLLSIFVYVKINRGAPILFVDSNGDATKIDAMASVVIDALMHRLRKGLKIA
jgi:hypothetical protein